VKKPNRLLKLAVIVTSVLLVGQFIAYRAGAFQWLMVPRPEPAESEKVEVPKETPSESTPPTMIGGSKSLWGPSVPLPKVTPGDPPTPKAEQPPPESPKQKPTIMPGSKSPGVLFPPNNNAPGSVSRQPHITD
jgi:hypothetical protein